MIEIYTKEDCSYCTTAKQLLTMHNKPYVEYKLGEDFTREILLSKYPEASTYPVIVIDGFNIGGCDQLKTMLTESVSDTRKFLVEN